MNIETFLNKLIQKENLTKSESYRLLMEMMKKDVTSSQIAAILTAFRMKGETTDEILGFIQAMREQMVGVAAKNALDVCGTGGDNAGTFNVSTAVAFVVAGAGVHVAKHGNRAASSKCGSADVLEALGVNIHITKQQAADVLKKVGMVFLFAPLFHPSMKQVGVVRKELKVRTIFNFLGPFANPASVKRQIIGVPNGSIAKKLAQVAKKLGYQHVLIVASRDGLDEISIFAKTDIYIVKNKSIRHVVFNPQDFGFTHRIVHSIKGGSIQQNAEILRRILQGKKGPMRDMVILNSAYAFMVAGKVKTVREGIDLANASIDSKKAYGVLTSLIQETQKYAH